MKRIMVMGVSAGAGKSTLARIIGEELGLDVYHLDTFHWKPGWIEAPREEFIGNILETVERESWIIEGNYTSTYEARAMYADAIVYVELPLLTCLYRVIKRWWQNRGRTRIDLGEGCEEKMDYEFLKFIVTTYYKRRKTMRERFRMFHKEDIRRKVILLRSRKDVSDFVQNLRETKRL